MRFMCSLCGHALIDGVCRNHCDRPCSNGKCRTCQTIDSLAISASRKRVGS